MVRPFCLVLLLLLHLQTLAMPARAQAPALPYTNPVIGDARRVQQPVADPFVLKWNGEYYLYASGEPIRAYRSTDLVHWQPLGAVLSPGKAWKLGEPPEKKTKASEKAEAPPKTATPAKTATPKAASPKAPMPKGPMQTDVWAPEVVYREGKFYLYYTATRKSPDWRISEAERRVGVAVADKPTGPFVDAGQPVSKTWAIDGTVFKDPDGGQEYLFYSYLFEPKLPGAGIVVDRLSDWSTAAGKPALVTRGSEAWEDKDGDPSNGSVRYTNEGPVVAKRMGRYIMMYSGGSWDLPTYAVGYATSEKLLRGDLKGPGWRKVGPPFLRGTRLVEGPGHHTLVKAPNNVDDICVHHARVVPFADPGDRLPFVARLTWEHDRPSMAPPTTAEQPPPDRPLFEDSFTRAAGPLTGAGWKIERGKWSIADGQLQQTKAEGAARVVARIAPLASYVFEANLRFAAVGAESGFVGVTAFDAGPENHVDVLVDVQKHSLVSSGRLGGKAVAEVRTRLPGSFVPETYHQLLITKNAGRLLVALDGVHLQARRLAMGSGVVALQTRGAKAVFDAVAVTGAFEDDFRPGREACANLECLGWTPGAGTWKLAAGHLQQTDTKAERALAIKGDLAHDYELTATLRWGKATVGSARAGVAAAATDKGDLVLVSLGRNIWPFARLHLQHIANGKVARSFGVGLPRGFDYAVPHTLRVVRQGEAFTVFLDGKETAAARFPVGLARGGLYSASTDVSFLSVAWKRLVVPQNYALNGSFETEQWYGARATRDNPWQLEGTARPSECCAHTGQRRLLVAGGPGRARQKVTGLPAGRYTLRAWASAGGAAEAELSAQVAGSTPVRARSRAGGWSRLSLDVHVPQNGQLEIALGATMDKGASAAVGLDDVYLFRN